MHIFVVLLAVVMTHAQAGGPSARRAPGAPYQPYFEAARRSARAQRPPFAKPARAASATERAIPYDDSAGLRPAPEWESTEALTARFRHVRDARTLTSAWRPDFARRVTWLYPDDGCYARAAVAMRLLRAAEPTAPLPGKVFLFGDLAVQTVNSPAGRVEWWYHVAPIVRVGERHFVLDPAIEPTRPLALEEWVTRQTRTPASTQIAICGSGTVGPSDRCDAVSDGVEAGAFGDLRDYLVPEWKRLIRLGRVPERELGPEPPWCARDACR